MIDISEVRIGSVVLVRPDFGQGARIKVTVDEVDDDIKNGRPGIGYNDSWAYLTQVDKVVKY